MKMRKYMRFTLAVLQAVLDICLYGLLLVYVSHITALEVLIFLTGTMFVCFMYSGLHGFRNWTLWNETCSVLKAGVLMLLLSVLYFYANKFSVPLFPLLAGIVIFIPVVLAARYFFRHVFFSLGLLSTSVIILGAGEAGETFAKSIVSSPFTARKVECFLDDDDAKQGELVAGVPVMGRLKDFDAVQSGIHAEEAVIAIPTASRKTLADILGKVEDSAGRVLYIPDMFMLTTYTANIRSIDGLPVISSSQGLLNPVNVFIKTVIDYIGAVAALLVFSPLMLWAAYRIKKEDGGPVFFNRERIGWKAQRFTTYKFRTMYTDAEERTKILFKNPEILAAYKEGIKMKDDPRVTKIGAFLRKTSIDELPQLINILRGEMSLVGPRPLPQFDVDLLYSDEHILRKVYAAKPGLTGIWQVSGRSDLDAEFRRKINCYYVHNWSVWLDLAILLKTPLAVVTEKGAY